MNNWNKSKVKDLCFRIGDGLHGTPKYDDKGDIYFINGNNLKSGKIEITKDTKKVSQVELDKNYVQLDENTLFLSINGTLGSMAFYNDEKVMLGKSAAYLNFKSSINSFYYYYFQLKGVQEYFHNVATGSTIKNLGLKTIQEFEVPVPKENEWKQIAKVLSDLDAKIEINNKINAELEAMAKTLYDYWFVQFDFPFDFAQGKPDANGKPYKSSGGLMVFNEELKREIPVGWEDGMTKDLFLFNPTLSVKKGNITSFFDMNSLPTKGFMTKPVQKKAFSGGMKFQNDDVVVARITPCLENGKTALISLLEGDEIGFGSTEFIVIRGVASNLKSFACCLSRSEAFRKYSISKMTGTSGRKRVKADALANFKMPIPTKDILESFENKVSVFFDKMSINTKENQKLSELRDWLLPMLMNGQVTSSASVTKDTRASATEYTITPATESLDKVAENSTEYKKK